MFEYTCIFSIQGIKGVTFVVRLSETPWDQDTLRLNDEKQKPEVLNMLSARGIETVILFLEALTVTLFLVNGIFVFIFSE